MVDRPFSSMPSNIDDEKLVLLRSMGATQHELAEMFGVSQSLIHNKIKSLGICGVRNKGISNGA